MSGDGQDLVKSGIFSLRRLRWKLTLSYTLVTLATLLAAELVVLAALAAFFYSPVLPYLIAQEMERALVPQLEPHLAETPPDRDAIREELDFFAQQSGVEGSDQAGSDRESPGPGTNLSITPDDGALFVVDEDQELLVSVPELRGFPEQRRFDAGAIDDLSPLVRRALDGEQDLWVLSDRGPEGRMLGAVPIEDDNGNTIGALVGTFQFPNLTAAFVGVIIGSAIALVLPAAFIGTVFGFLTARGLTRRLNKLAAAVQAWSKGDFAVRTEDRSRDELGQLSREMNDMASQLETLIETRGELATLEARNRFARDLHDSVKQQVFATSLQVATARSLVNRDPAAAGEHLAQAGEMIRQAQKELNVLIHEMRPAALGDKGLSRALQEYADKWSEGSEIPSEVHVRGGREIPLETEQTVFRVAQEALANVAKHSGARAVDLDLIYTPDTLTLRVSDDGSGFDTSEDPGEGFGLQSMRERSARLGGRVEVESTPGEGTRITCTVPIEGAASEKGVEQ
ncbi:MAG: histidine kinase [Rubrobacteraceae bacterium]